MRLAESDDSYPRVVAILNGQWRVIECRDRIQWFLQRRNRAKSVAKHAWRGRSYCRTREALIRCCNEHAGQIDPAARKTLEGLPAWFSDPKLALLWQILSGAGFPNQFFCDSWVVGLWRGRRWEAEDRIGGRSLDAF